MIWKGTDITQKGTRFTWKRGDGWVSFPQWHGSYTRIVEIVSLLETTNGVDSMSIEPLDDGSWMLNAWGTTESSPTTPAEEPPVNEWRLVGQDNVADIRLHPRALALGVDIVAGITQMVADLKAIKDFEEERTAYFERSAILQAAASLAGKSATDAQYLLDHLLLGYETVPSPTYVLQHRKTVTRRWVGKVSFSNLPYGVYVCDGIGGHSSALVAELVAAGTPLDPELFFELSDIPAPTAKPGFVFGWIKKPPSSIPNPAKKREIEQEYWLDQWSTFIYTPV